LLVVTEFKATKSHPQAFNKGPPRVGAEVRKRALMELENKEKLKPFNWLTQNTIWSANYTNYWGLI